jgi:hypothetical protein
LAPQAARIIANAIANAASPTFSRGQDKLDATPVDQLRLITPDTRRYQLTNLDYAPAEPFRERLESTAGQYAPNDTDHPYKDAQPIVSAPPLSSPRVQGGNYVGVDNAVEGNSAVSRVDLRLRNEQGRHLRLDPSTKSLEAVGFSALTESPKALSAEFRESADGTELVVSLRNLEQVNLLLANADSRVALVFPQAAAVGPASLAAGGTRTLSRQAIRLASGESRDILAWTDGAVTPAPTPPVAACIAYVVYNATRNDTDTGNSTDGNNVLIVSKSANVTSVKRIDSNRWEIAFSPSLSTANYAICGSASQDDDDLAVLTVRSLAAPTASLLTVTTNVSGNGAVQPKRVSVLLFA